MESIKERLNLITFGTIGIDLLVIALGLFLMTNPAVGLESALLLIGILLLISGISSIIKYIMHPIRFFRFELIYGAISIVAGILAIFKPFEVIALITSLIAIWLIISSIIKLIMAIELKRNKEETWIFDITVAALVIILGILIIFNPFSSSMLLSVYVGVMITIYAAMDIVEQFFIRKRINSICKIFKK
ncbi:MAG: DUF308 domain-containing protein [Candidatus Riflebacteria bacterium]|nr:DUF308 domain-containing protein [Candidatus Riflebacteria bacterium]